MPNNPQAVNQEFIDALQEQDKIDVIEAAAKALDEAWYTQIEKDKLALISATIAVDLDKIAKEAKDVIEWIASTPMLKNKIIVDPATNNTYLVVADYTTGLSTAADIGAGRIIPIGGGSGTGVQSWATGENYKVGMIVLDGDRAYTVSADYISGINIPADIAAGKLISISKATKTVAWTIGTQYGAGSMVYGTGGEGLFVVAADYTSGADILVDVAANSLVPAVTLPNSKIQDWAPGKSYKAGMLILTKDDIYIVQNDYTSGVSIDDDINAYAIVSAKLEDKIQRWIAGKEYSPGMIVLDGDKAYTVAAHYTSGTTIAADLTAGSLVAISKPTKTVAWVTATSYTAGSMLYGTNGEGLFVVVADYVSGVDIAADETAGAIVPAVSIPDAKVQTWTAGTDYKVGMLVLDDNKVYTVDIDYTSGTSASSDIFNGSLLTPTSISEFKTREAIGDVSITVGFPPALPAASFGSAVQTTAIVAGSPVDVYTFTLPIPTFDPLSGPMNFEILGLPNADPAVSAITGSFSLDALDTPKDVSGLNDDAFKAIIFSTSPDELVLSTQVVANVAYTTEVEVNATPAPSLDLLNSDAIDKRILESSAYFGTFASLHDLNAAIGVPEKGHYAIVSHHADYLLYIYEEDATGTMSWVDISAKSDYNMLGFFDDIATLQLEAGKDGDYAIVKDPASGNDFYIWDSALASNNWQLFAKNHAEVHIFMVLQFYIDNNGKGIKQDDLVFITHEQDSKLNGLYFAKSDGVHSITGLKKFVYSTADILSDAGGSTRPLDQVLEDMDRSSMMLRAPIDQISDITEVGIYHGPATAAQAKILDAPIDGPGMIMASRDASGNWGYLFMGQDMVLRPGGRPFGSAVPTWTSAGAGSFVPLASQELNMDNNLIINVSDPRSGTTGEDDAVNKHFMNEALAARSLYQGAYSPGHNLPDLIALSDSDFTPPVADDSISSPSSLAPLPAAGNITVWFRPADNVFGTNYPINISSAMIITINISSGKKVVSSIPSGDYLTKTEIEDALRTSLIDMSKGIVNVHFFKTGSGNLPWIGIETINSYATGVEFEGESATAGGGLSSGQPGINNKVLNSYNWVVATVDADLPELALPGIPGIQVGEKLYNGDVLQWSATVNSFELFRSGTVTKSFANENYWSTTEDNMKWQNITYKKGAIVLSNRAFYQASRAIVRGEAEPGTQQSIGIWQLLNEDSGAVVFFGQGDYDVTHTTEQHNWGMPSETYPLNDTTRIARQPHHRDIYLDTVKGSVTTFEVRSIPPVFTVSGSCDAGSPVNPGQGNPSNGTAVFLGELSEGPSTGHEDVLNFLIDGSIAQLDINSYYTFENTTASNLAVTKGMLIGVNFGPGTSMIIWTNDKDAQHHGWAVIREDSSTSPYYWSLNTPNPTPIPDVITATTHVNDFYGNALIGEIKMWASMNIPFRHMLCDGTTFDELVYPELYLALGGSNILPDLRGQFVRGARTQVEIDGFNKLAWSTGKPKASMYTDETGNHRHPITVRDDESSTGHVDMGGGGGARTYYTDYAGNHKHYLASGGDAETAPDHVKLAYIIRCSNG